MITKTSSTLLGRLKDFIKTGFLQEAIQARDNAFNVAVKANKKNMITGVYPNFEIAYDQLLLSAGNLKPARTGSSGVINDRTDVSDSLYLGPVALD